MAGGDQQGTVTETGTAKGDITTQELSRAQQVAVRRVAEAKATIPELVLRCVVAMDACVALRARLESQAADDRPVPALEDMVVRACALALREHPRANGAYRDGRVELYSRVNVGVVVHARDAPLVPTVFDADRRPLGELAASTRALTERAHEGSITSPELGNATFTVSSLGALGVASFAAAVIPPQAAILAAGAVEERAVVEDGAAAIGQRMDLTLTCDHRILFGAGAGAFLARVRDLLEHPLDALL
ncbi:MAG TPA: 2-oxo acid dehydrogenase subunit E2 [Solirubrobacteraceae bacterium]|nr:2-oxo acid dehydrogenase subunit E2 [Solirubrobacteraceae bacterium]